MKMENKILVIDIETTALSPKQGCIVEIGATELNIKTGKTKIVFDSLVREKHLTAKHREYLDVKNSGGTPSFKHMGWIFGNSDLTPEMVREAPLAEDVFPKLQALIDKYELGCTAFNSSFDFGYLEHRGFNIPKKQRCPMRVSAPIMKLPHKNGRGVGKFPSVEEAWAYLFPDDPYTELHRGADDSEREAKIVYELIKRGFYTIE
jgi:DNA polymerase-3 subunit epsilon